MFIKFVFLVDYINQDINRLALVKGNEGYVFYRIMIVELNV